MVMRDVRGPITGILSIAVALALVGRMAGLVSQSELDLIGVASLGWVMFRLAETWGIGTVVAASVGLLTVGGLFSLNASVPGLTLMPYLLLVPANLFVAWMFARGLFPGREPILLRLIRLMEIGPTDDPQFRSFVWGQCLLWAVLAIGNVIVGIAAVPFAAATPWMDDLLLAMGAGQIIWFAVSHHYAATRYGRRETWWTTARAMTRPDILTRLTAP